MAPISPSGCEQAARSCDCEKSEFLIASSTQEVITPPTLMSIMLKRLVMTRVFLVSAATIAFFLIPPETAYGRVGETVEQCTQRYGAPTPRNKSDGANLVRFEQGADLEIQCYFDGLGGSAKCEAIDVSKGIGAILELPQVNKILDGNKGSSKWEEPTTQETPLGVEWHWRTKDGKLVATSIFGGLTIETVERRNREAAARRDKAKQEVGNF